MKHLTQNDIATMKEAYMNEPDANFGKFKEEFAIVIGVNDVLLLKEMFQSIYNEIRRGQIPSSSTVGEYSHGYYIINNITS